MIRHLICFFVLIFPLILHAQLPPVLQSIPEGVEVIENITFAEYDGYTLQLDLYRPTNITTYRPAIVVVSEGGWANANKELNAPLAAGLAKKGFIAVSIEYRGASEVLLPAAVHDTKAAVRWLRANAQTYHIDPDAIGAIGGSWGGYLSVYSGLTNGVDELEGNGGSNEFSSDINAVVGLSTPTNLPFFPPRMERYFADSYADNPELWEFSSPVNHVSENSPPLLLIASQADTTVPYEQSLELVEAYGTNNLEVELWLIPEAGHAFWYFPDIFEQSIEKSVIFFRYNLIDKE